ncbi:MAG: aminotransferase class I/II-fold pyridoxal phosphate-dependent enzyme [Patescibacteria group bacterium]
MFDRLENLPLDPIFQLVADYQADPNPKKVDLGIGLYADLEGKPFVFPVVRKVFQKIDINNFNYQPIGGNKDFLRLSAELLFGKDVDSENLALHTVCGGTQACSLFNGLLAKEGNKNVDGDGDNQSERKILIATPTWPNHFAIFKSLPVVKFPHLDEAGEVNLFAHKEAVENAGNGSVLILHGGLTHNPTGRNLSLEQLKELIPLLREKSILVYLDFAYLGFGEGLEEDKKYAKLLFDELEDVALGLSFSKNASLYEHRTGVLIIKTKNKKSVESQLRQLTRESISMAPGAGQEVMTYILGEFYEEWEKEVNGVLKDIEYRKDLLLSKLGSEFDKLRECRGMFGLLPLTREQILRLKKESSVYIAESGRVNFAGLKPKDVDYIAEAIQKVRT